MHWNIKRIPQVHDEYRQKLESFSEKKKIVHFSDWYKVSTEEIKGAGLKSILHVHGNSLIKTLQEVFPEFEWKPWFFEKQKLPEGKSNSFFCHCQGTFVNTNTQREFLEDFQKARNLSFDDWYNVKVKDIIDFGGGNFFILTS